MMLRLIFLKVFFISGAGTLIFIAPVKAENSKPLLLPDFSKVEHLKRHSEQDVHASCQDRTGHVFVEQDSGFNSCVDESHSSSAFNVEQNKNQNLNPNSVVRFEKHFQN